MPLRPNYPLLTARLLLRPLQESDVPALVSYHSSPEVHRYLPMGPMDADVVTTRVTGGPWSRSTLEYEGDLISLGVELTTTGELIGDVMLRWLSATDRCGELGYVFHPDHGGHGYATEAAQAILQLAFGDLDLHRMIARVDTRNSASLNVVRRLGMRMEAHFVQSHRDGDGWADEMDFALVKGEWRPGLGLK